MKTLKTSIFLAVLSSAILTASAAPQNSAPAVRVEAATTLDRTEGKTFVGKVTGSETVEIVARVSGTLWKAAFKEGSIVQKGDLLFHIEDTVYKENLNAAQAVLAQIDAQLAFAKKERDRYTRLYTTKAASETAYENAVRNHELCKAQRAEALARGALMANDLSYTKIYAPVTGRIGKNFYSEGNYITPAKGVLATIVKFNPAKVTFAMSESDFYDFAPKGILPADGLKIRRADGKEYTGKITVAFFDNQVDSSTGTVAVELNLANPDMQLLPGGYVTVNLSKHFAKPQPAVPASAILTDGTKHYLYCVGADDRVERREVVTGETVGTRQIISSGIAPGELVISGGMHKVRPGITVNPVRSGK